jgi:hypothetical protein
MAEKTGFLVLGAGLPRTGTSSTREALTELLQGPCYHMETVVFGKKEERDHWHRALDDLTKTGVNCYKTIHYSLVELCLLKP